MEIPPSEFCQITGDWGKLEIPKLARMSLIKCYRVTVLTVSELLKENQQGEGKTQIRVKMKLVTTILYSS